MSENEREILERAKLERELKRLDSFDIKRYSPNPSNPYKIASIVLSGGLLIGCFSLLMWLVGRKSGKDKCGCRD